MIGAVLPLVMSVVGEVAKGGKGKEEDGGMNLASLIDPLGLLGGKDKKEESNPIAALLNLGGGEGKGPLSMLG